MTTISVKFFGQYLLEKGRITQDQLLEAVSRQRSANPLLGALALERGYLTPAQADAINAAQRTTDRMFGDLAVDMGLLDPDQLAELLDLQRSSRLFLGEAFVDKGILSAGELEAELTAFEAEQHAGQMMIRGALMQLQGVEFVVDVLDLVLKTFKRLVHETVLIEDCHQERDSWDAHDVTVSQRFIGDVDATLTLGLPRDTAVKIASKMLGEEIAGDDALVLDATREFLNVICGNVCSKQSQRDLNVDLKAPVVTDAPAGLPLTDGYTVITVMAAIDSKVDVALVLPNVLVRPR